MTLMYAPQHWCASVKSATLAHPEASVSSVEVRVSRYVDSTYSSLRGSTYSSGLAHLHFISQDAYYCAECTRLEKDRDGCPKVVNLGASRTDLAYLRKARNQQQQ